MTRSNSDASSRAREERHSCMMKCMCVCARCFRLQKNKHNACSLADCESSRACLPLSVTVVALAVCCRNYRREEGASDGCRPCLPFSFPPPFHQNVCIVCIHDHPCVTVDCRSSALRELSWVCTLDLTCLDHSDDVGSPLQSGRNVPRVFGADPVHLQIRQFVSRVSRQGRGAH